MINPVYFYVGAAVIAISGMTWFVKDIRERGKLEAYAEINAMSQESATKAQEQRIADIKTGMAVTDAAMLARSAVKGAINEKAQLLIAETGEKGNGRGEICGDMVAHRSNAGGVPDGSARGGANSVRLRENADSVRAGRAEENRRPGQSQNDIRRNQLIKLAAKCDEIAADYNALLAICQSEK